MSELPTPLSHPPVHPPTTTHNTHSSHLLPFHQPPLNQQPTAPTHFDPKLPVETQSCLHAADLRQYLDSHGQNNMSIVIRHAKVVQKSYGTEKRFFCPPPIVKLIGEGWKRKDKNNSRTGENLNEFHAWIRIGAPQDRQLTGDGFDTSLVQGTGINGQKGNGQNGQNGNGLNGNGLNGNGLNGNHGQNGINGNYRVVLQKCHENGRKWLKMTKKDQNLGF